METKEIRLSNYTLNLISTKKFKTSRIQISFGNDLLEETVTTRCLLPYIMHTVSKKYDTREKMSSYLEDMYAANFNVGVSKIGQTHFVSFDLSIINDEFTLNSEPLFKKALDFLQEVIFNPFFSDTVFKEEIRLLREYFEGIYTNKLKYAIQEMRNIMFENEIYKINALGLEKDLEHITLAKINEEYEKMINSDLITITVVGDIDFNLVEQEIKEHFNFRKRSYSPVLLEKNGKLVTSVNKVVKRIDVSQAKLVVGYRNETYFLSEDYYSTIIFNVIFGASSESLLFKTIREEKSLVYFINSSYDPYKGVVFITSGIKASDFDEVIMTTNQIIQDIINLNFDDELLETAKSILINRLIEGLDSNHSIMDRAYRNSLFGVNTSIEEIIIKLNLVKKEDVGLMAGNLILDTIYLLRGEKDE